MGIPQRFFNRRLLSEEIGMQARRPPDPFSGTGVLPPDYMPKPDNAPLPCPPEVARELERLGLGNDASARLLLAVRMLKGKAGRGINVLVFARILTRYRMKLGTLAALASLCRQDAADIGITLRSLARFFKRSRKGERDLPEIERFIEWAVQRGECVKGVPTAWKEYCRHGRDSE